MKPDIPFAASLLPAGLTRRPASFCQRPSPGPLGRAAAHEPGKVGHPERSPTPSIPDEPDKSRHYSSQWCKREQCQAELQGTERSTRPDNDRSLHEYTDKDDGQCDRDSITLPWSVLESRVHRLARTLPIPL